MLQTQDTKHQEDSGQTSLEIQGLKGSVALLTKKLYDAK